MIGTVVCRKSFIASAIAYHMLVKWNMPMNSSNENPLPRYHSHTHTNRNQFDNFTHKMKCANFAKLIVFESEFDLENKLRWAEIKQCEGFSDGTSDWFVGTLYVNAAPIYSQPLDFIVTNKVSKVFVTTFVHRVKVLILLLNSKYCHCHCQKKCTFRSMWLFSTSLSLYQVNIIN